MYCIIKVNNENAFSGFVSFVLAMDLNVICVERAGNERILIQRKDLFMNIQETPCKIVYKR